MIYAGLIIKAYRNFFIGGHEKMKFFNEWLIEFVEFVEFVELRGSQSLPQNRIKD